MTKKMLVSAVLLIGGVNAFTQGKQQPKPIPDQYIVVIKESAATPVIKQQKKNEDREQKFKDNNNTRETNLKKLNDVKERKNIKEESVKNNYSDAIVGFAAKLSKEEADALKNDPEVAGVYPDMELSFIIPDIKTDETIFNPGDCFLTRAGGAGDGSSNGRWIWILDNGLDLTHPDLNIVTKIKNVNYAISFVPDEPSPAAYHEHGTMVAGIAAAKNNGVGMTGVAAGAKVVPVKIAKGILWQQSWLIAGLDHVAKYGVPGDVVNLSIGSSGGSDCNMPAKDAIVNLGNSGIWVCIAAGNEGSYASFSFPGCVEGTRIVTVGALNCNLTCASYSNFGPGVDFYAVGTNVYTCILNGRYGTGTGTSFAAPVVAGILQLRGYPGYGSQIQCKEWIKPVAMR
jgi:hypothetical protein